MANCQKLLERQEYQTILPVSWKICMWVKKHELEPYMEQMIVSRLRKEYDKAVCCHHLFNLYTEHIIRNAGLNAIHVGIKIGGRNINNLKYADDATLMAESKEELKSLLMRAKEESETANLRPNIKKKKKKANIMASSPIISLQLEGQKWK